MRPCGWAKDRQTPSRLHVISDARTGAVVGSYDEIESIAGTGNSSQFTVLCFAINAQGVQVMCSSTDKQFTDLNARMASQRPSLA